MPPSMFREQVRRALGSRRKSQALTRKWLAGQIFLDPKTLNAYLADPDYGDNGQPLGFPPNLGNGVAHLIYMVSTTTGDLLYVNDPFCEHLGYRRDEVIGMPAAPLLRPGEDIRTTEPEISCGMQELIQGKRNRFFFDQWLCARDGRKVWLHTVAMHDPMKYAWLLDCEPFSEMPLQLPLPGATIGEWRGIKIGDMRELTKIAAGLASYALIDLGMDGRLDGLVMFTSQCLQHRLLG